MRCTKSLAWGTVLFILYLFVLGSVWIGLKGQLPFLDHPLAALAILGISYLAMERSVVFLAKRGNWSC